MALLLEAGADKEAKHQVRDERGGGEGDPLCLRKPILTFNL